MHFSSMFFLDLIAHFLLVLKKYFIIWIYHSLFKCLPTEEHLGSSKRLKIMNKVVTKSVFRVAMCVDINFQLPLSKYTAAGSWVAFPTAMKRVPVPPHPYQLWCCQCLDFDHCNRCVWYHTVVLSCSSLTMYGDKYLFIDLLAICISSSVRCLFMSFAYFLIGLFLFLLLSFKSLEFFSLVYFR